MISFINSIHHQVIVVTVEIDLVDATHRFLGMVATAYRIPVTGQCFMKKLPWHIPERKYQQEKYGDQFFYGLRVQQAKNFDKGR